MICDFALRDRYLFHLVFNIETRKVKFEPVAWNEDWTDQHRVISIDKTLYDIHIVSEFGMCFSNITINYLGRQFIRGFHEFGDYHYISELNIAIVC